MMCEKCWNDAYLRSYGTGRSQVECYRELLDERKDNPCSKAERLGQWADENGNDVRSVVGEGRE